jgi:hypothetical protein
MEKTAITFTTENISLLVRERDKGTGQWGRPKEVEVEAQTCQGLAIHHCTQDYPFWNGFWVVTHVATGMKLHRWARFYTLAAAKDLVERLLPIANWRQNQVIPQENWDFEQAVIQAIQAAGQHPDEVDATPPDEGDFDD